MSTFGRNSVGAGVISTLALVLMVRSVYAQVKVHVVQPGETLSFIAVRYGTTAQAMALANGLSNPNHIYAGQQLTIPTAGNEGGAVAAGGAYSVRAGDTLSSIAARR